MSTCPNCRGATTAVLGHGDPFPPRWLNVRCVIRHGTFAETNGNGRDAPRAVRHPEVPAGQHPLGERLGELPQTFQHGGVAAIPA